MHHAAPLRFAALGVVAGFDAPSCAPGADEAAPESPRPTSTSQAASPTPPSEAVGDQKFPDVLSAELERTGGAWRVSATISSPYDHPDRYADAFRVLAPDGTVLGVRELLHDHAGEQPFTRSLQDLEIPEGVDEITVEGRDLQHGRGGDTVTVEVPS